MKLAIIPARGGSKRISRKNLKSFAGRPLIAWSIIRALESKIFDQVIVSTDDNEIAVISKSYGAGVPFMRPKELSDDYVGVLDVIKHALGWYRENEISVEYVCCIFPTAPFINTHDLKIGFDKLISNQDRIVMSVCEYSSPIQRALNIDPSGVVSPVWPKKIKERTQDLEPTYYDAGQFYWGEENTLFNSCKALISEQSIGIILPNVRVQDIDNIQDLNIAEAKFLNLEKQKIIPKLTIGTANFTQNYGIISTRKGITEEELKKIFNYLDDVGINKIDTAISYGETHKILGKIGIDDYELMTKLPSIPDNLSNIEFWVNEQIESALIELSLERIDGVYFHDSLQLQNSEIRIKACKALQSLKSKGLISKIGVSIYSPSILEELTQEIDLDIVQAPLNIIDRRIIDSGWMEKLKKLDIEVVVRSVFLQGLLLIEPTTRPPYFNRWDEIFQKYDYWVEEKSISRLEACMQFILSFSEINGIIFGVDHLKQLKEISKLLRPSTLDFPKNIKSNDEGLVNPSKWEI
jgi:pseudaminic acid cytidylyltransferase